VRAVSRMPATAISSMTSTTAVSITMFGPVLVALAPKTASTDGPSTTTGPIVPTMLPMIISQPVRNPR
jgi:hypothetical protein